MPIDQNKQVIIDYKAKVEKALAGIKKISTATDKLKKKVKGAMSGFNKTYTAGALAGLGLLTKKLSGNADALIKNAKAAGINFESYQRLQFGLEQAGISNAGFQKSLLKANKAFGEASSGVKTYTDAFAEVGLSVEELSRLSPEERYREIVRAVNAIEDPSLRSAAAQELLGKEFAQNVVNIDDVVAAGEGIVPIDQSVAEGAEKMNDSINRLSTSLSNLTTNILLPLAAGLTPIVEGFAAFAKEHPDLTKLGIALTALGIAIKVMGGPVTAIVLGIAGLVAIWKNWDAIVDTFKDKWQTFSDAFPGLSSAITAAIDLLKLPFKQMKAIFSGFFEGIKDIFSGNIVTGIKKAINGILEGVALAIEQIPFIGEDAAKGFREKFIFQLEETKKDALDRSPIPDLVNGVDEKLSELAVIGQKRGEDFRKALTSELDKANASVSESLNAVNSATDSVSTRTAPIRITGDSVTDSFRNNINSSFKDGLKGAFKTALKGGDVGEALKQMVTSILDKIIDKFLDDLFKDFDLFGEEPTTATTGLVTPTTDVGVGGATTASATTAAGSNVAASITTAGNTASSALTNAGTNMSSGITTAGTTFNTGLTTAGSTVSTGLSTTVSTVSSTLNTTISTLTTTMSTTMRTVGNTLANSITNAGDSAASAIRSAASSGGGGLGGGGGGSIFGGLFGFSSGGIVPELGMSPQYFAKGGFAKGTDTVPAMLTPGEMILTKKQQESMMGGQTINVYQTINSPLEVGPESRRLIAEETKKTISDNPRLISASNKTQNRRDRTFGN